MEQTNFTDAYGISRELTLVVKQEDIYTIGGSKSPGSSSKRPEIPINELLYEEIMQGVQLKGNFPEFAGFPLGKFPFPLANPEFAEFLPSPVENEWETRFEEKRCVRSSNSSQNSFKLIWMGYPSDNCGCSSNDAPENLFFDDISKEWNKLGIGIRVIASQFEVDKGTGHVAFHEEKPFLIILHDVYHHPLCLFELLNGLNKKFTVIMPYMHDIVLASERYVQDKVMLAMCDKIGDILDLLVDNYVDDFKEQFGILAHGASCELAVSVSAKFKCSKLTLLSPLGKILPMPRNHETETEEDAKMFFNLNSEHSISAESDAGVLTGVLGQSNGPESDEIPQVTEEQHQKSNIRLSIARRPSCAAGMLIEQGCYMEELAAQAAGEVANESEHYTANCMALTIRDTDENRKSFALQERRFSTTNAVLVGKAQMHRKSSNRITEVSGGSDKDISDLYELINAQMELIYQEPEVVFSLLEAAGLKSVADLHTTLTAKKLGGSSLKRARLSFFEILPSICVFCNLEVLKRYKNALSVLDREFFRAMNAFTTLLHEPVELGEEQTIILLGSHDCFLTRENLEYIVQIDEKYDEIQCRTVLGAGHDLFDIAIELIKGIV